MSRKRSIGILAGFLALFCFSCDYLFSERMIEIQHLKSPNGDREAILKKTESNNSYLVTKNVDKILETRNPIYSETNFDGDTLTDFVSRYPVRKWIDNRTFFIGFNEEYKNSKDIVLIKNLSSKTIDKIKIDPIGIYFVYDVQPDEAVKIPVVWSNKGSLPKSIECGLSAEVYFSDGTIIPLNLSFADAHLDDYKDQAPCENAEIKVFDKEIVFSKLPENIDSEE